MVFYLLIELLKVFFTFQKKKKTSEGITCGSDYYFNVRLKLCLLLSSSYCSSFACFCFSVFVLFTKNNGRSKALSISMSLFICKNSFQKSEILMLLCPEITMFSVWFDKLVFLFSGKRNTIQNMLFYPRMAFRINSTACYSLMQHATRVTTVQSTVFASHPEGNHMHQDLRTEPLEYGRQGNKP